MTDLVASGEEAKYQSISLVGKEDHRFCTKVLSQRSFLKCSPVEDGTKRLKRKVSGKVHLIDYCKCRGPGSIVPVLHVVVGV